MIGIELSETQRAKLVSARLALGMTQQAVADAMGVHRVAVASLETGGRRVSQEMLQRWGAAVGLAVDVDIRVRISVKFRKA